MSYTVRLCGVVCAFPPMTRWRTLPLVRSLPSRDAAALAVAVSALTRPLKIDTPSTWTLALARAFPLLVELLTLARPLAWPPLPVELTYPCGPLPSPLSRAYAAALAVATRAILAVGLSAPATPAVATTAAAPTRAAAALRLRGITDPS